MFSSSYFSYILDWFHNFNCSLILGVVFFIIFLIYFLFFECFFFKINGFEYQLVEFFCSLLPVFFLLAQIYPSLGLLYYFGLIDSFGDLTVKVIGHQWYWSYDYSDFSGLEFDSYIKSLDLLDYGDYRVLEVDNRCVLPSSLRVRFCITSRDVIHSWTVFSFPLKLDAMSGILRVVYFDFPMVGVYYGQCSEICGVNHSFIPIVLELTLFNLFKFWCLGF